jgi:hypothetical protein
MIIKYLKRILGIYDLMTEQARLKKENQQLGMVIQRQVVFNASIIKTIKKVELIEKDLNKLIENTLHTLTNHRAWIKELQETQIIELDDVIDKDDYN